MRIGILGPLEVEHDDRRLVVGGGRVQLLLARLAIDVGASVSSASLADAIWDGAPPGDELHALQSLVSRLRRALGDPGLVAQSGGGYRLTLSSDDVDASRFARLAAEGSARLRDGDPRAARSLLGEALTLWRGPALGDLGAGPALAAAAAHLDELRVTALADRVQADMTLGRVAELVAELEAAVAARPLHERLAGQLMRALYAAGRQADALAVYERVRVRLDDELGVAPAPALQDVHLAVLRGELEARSPTPTPVPRSSLPARLTSFVGRQAELARLDGLLATDRLITLVGPGGAGKTRLATEAADRVARARATVWLVELASVTGGDAIAPAIAGALGLREMALLGGRSAAGPSGGDALARIQEMLADSDGLLVIDNCEHLLVDVAHVADRLLAACPGLRLLCTSREPLGITGETLVAVAPLALPEGDVSAARALAIPAVALFADRAASASPGFVVDEATVADVVEVCRRVDGLPLAIELAAARLRAMTLSQLAARLDDRLRLLTGGSRTALARQRTLRAVLDWSWDLLDDRERALLRRLSVFSGEATLDAAEIVCVAGCVAAGDVFDLLCALVERSLVQNVDGHRYRMLETIREYCLDRLEQAGELAATRDAHARHFAELAVTAAPHLRGHEQLDWLARVRADHDNVLAALRHLGAEGDARRVHEVVVALLWFWLLSGSRQEVFTWTAFARDVAGDADPLDRVLVESVNTLAHAFSGEEAHDPWRILATALERIEDDDLSGHPLLAAVRPMLAVALGRERVLELLQRSAQHPDPWVRATVPFVRIQLSSNDGDVPGTRAALDESLAAFRTVGDRWGVASTLSELSSLRIAVGDLDGAERALEQTRSLMMALGVDDGGGAMRMRLADVRGRRGDVDGAVRILQDTLADGDRLAEETAMIKVALAHLQLRLGDLTRARELCDEARAQLGEPERRPAEQGHGHALALSTAALVELRSGELDAGERLLHDAGAVARGTDDMPLIATVGVVRATLCLGRGDERGAAELLGSAAAVRGTEDPTHPEVARLTVALRAALGDRGFQTAFDRGRDLEREAALAGLLSDATAVGAQGQRHEDHEQDPHPRERPQHV